LMPHKRFDQIVHGKKYHEGGNSSFNNFEHYLHYLMFLLKNLWLRMRTIRLIIAFKDSNIQL
jgi:hypothetical protein